MLPLRTHKRRSARDGFAVGAVLYTLGLAGVLSAVLFSSVGQGLKSTAQASNALADAGQIKNALNVLAASSVIGSDGSTFCPPRSSHSSEYCGGANQLLIRLADVSPTDAHLPQGWGSVTESGSPYEAAIFAPGAGVGQTDARGHYWIVCRWENPLTATTSPAFAVLGAGPSGKLQTKCGDTVGTNENILAPLSVAAAAHQSSAWNLDGTSAKFGAVGSQVSVDASGNLLTSGNITGGAGNFTSLTDSGALSVTGLASLSGGATVGGTLTAGTSSLGAVSASSLTSSGAISGTAGSFTSLTDSGDLIVNGSIGIGSSSPKAKLDVNGGIDIAGVNALRFPTDIGQTNGSIAIGSAALNSQDASGLAANNTAIGYQAGYDLTSSGNVAVGYMVGKTSMGGYSVAVGKLAGTSSMGGYSVAVGSESGKTSMGNNSVAVGNQAGYSSMGWYSVAVGNQAGKTSMGGYSVAVGNQAATLNAGTGTVAIGYGTAYSGAYTTAVGYLAGQGATGANNTAIGYQAGYDISSGANNIILGAYPTTSVGVTTGSSNILIGYDVRPPSRTSSNQLNIGNLIYGTSLGTGSTLSTGKIGIGTASPAATLDVNGSQIIVRTAATPASSTATCTAGTIQWDANYLYICTASNTYKRAALSSF